ncbi:MAG: hypothetical protein DRM99_02430 [Thermoplasmata archaeon]|nr:MAG: hypothetical protein DRM99_02430 [Thermoplasmata archaeon]
MKESIKTPVVVDEDDEKELEICLDWDVVDVYIDGKKIFSADWSNNLKEVFERALEIWSSQE